VLSLDHPYASWAVALGIGLLIGVERERRKGEGVGRAAAGVRTFAITSLLGAASMEIGGAELLSVTTAGVLALIALAYYRTHSEDPGLTTEIALVLTLVLGGLALREPLEAAALAVATAILLAARTPMHRFVRDVLTQSELKSALIFAAATLVVWPVIPDRYLGPFDAINLRSVWSIVILIMAISACGYIAVRALGSRYGLPASGFASGFVSSSATIAAMGAKVVAEPHLLAPAVAAAVLSTVATVAQISIVVAATSPETLLALAVPLILAGLAAVSYGLLFAFGVTVAPSDAPSNPGEAFSFKSALLLTAILAVVMVAAAALRTWFGDRGLVAAAAMAGFADAHATAVSMASQVAAGKMAARDACMPILVGFTTNSITKIILAVSSGSSAFALRVVPGLIIVLAAAWTGFVLGPL
jgi:uncharacterized membrane protein (DUF4010 family)